MRSKKSPPKDAKEFVTVFGWKIPVRRLNGLIESGMFGYYDDEKKEIGVDSSLKGGLAVHTLVHETFHAALDRLFVQSQLDEKFVEVLVEGLAVALMENFEVKKK